jgi:hypothetical protein
MYTTVVPVLLSTVTPTGPFMVADNAELPSPEVEQPPVPANGRITPVAVMRITRQPA